jgi:hypothetical protein
MMISSSTSFSRNSNTSDGTPLIVLFPHAIYLEAKFRGTRILYSAHELGTYPAPSINHHNPRWHEQIPTLLDIAIVVLELQIDETDLSSLSESTSTEIEASIAEVDTGDDIDEGSVHQAEIEEDGGEDAGASPLGSYYVQKNGSPVRRTARRTYCD